MRLAQGFHSNIKAEDYHADPCQEPSLSSSLAKVILQSSPRAAWFSHPRLNPIRQEDHEEKFDIGTAAHALLLEGENVMHVVDADDWRTKEAKAQRAMARADGLIPVLARQADAILDMTHAATEFLSTSEIVKNWGAGESEVTAIVEDEGTWFRARFDRWDSSGVIMDYKTTGDAAPNAFGRVIAQLGYHIQEAFYRHVALLLGVQAPRFVFLAQSTKPPHECSLHACAPSLQEVGDAEVKRAIGIWRTCMVAKHWPSHGGRIHWTEPALWQLKEHENRMVES